MSLNCLLRNFGCKNKLYNKLHSFVYLAPAQSSQISSFRSSLNNQQKDMSSSSSPYALAALKTKGIEKSVWVEFIQLALEVQPLNLGQGFPDFAAPDNVRKALADCSLDENNVLLNQYTRGFGHPRLVAALGKLYSKMLGRTLDPQTEIMVTAGAYEGIFVTLSGLVNPGDEVIIIEPFFDCYQPQTRIAGGIPVFVPLRPTKTEGKISSADWKLDPAELEAAFTPRTKAIIVNTPNNPLGKVFTLEELTAIADLCKKHNVYAIMDEVYEWMTYDGLKHIRMATLPGMWERTVTIGSAGKTFSVTGWKIGWVIAPKELLAGPKVMHQHCIYTCSTPVQEAVARGFEMEIDRFGTPDCYFLSLPAELQEKREKMVKILSDAGLNPIVPEGGYFILADVRKLMKEVNVGGDPSEPKDFRFVKWLSRHRKLQGIPPSAFFSDPHKYIGEDYIRFCFIKKDENLEQAGEILAQLKRDIDAGKV